MSLSEDNKKLFELAYDKTAESTFVMILGQALVDVDRSRGQSTYHGFSQS